MFLAAAFLCTFWFRALQLQRYDAFVPIANTFVCLNDMITAALLYLQYSITRRRELLVLASGFLFKALTMIPHALTFPGAFAPDGLLGAQVQTTAFLYMTQHLLFLLSAVAYTLLRDREEDAPAASGSPVLPIGIAAGAVVVGVLLMTWVFIAGANLLPPMLADPMHTSAGYERVGWWLLLLEALASIVVFGRPATSIIDLWLKVAMCGWLFETLLTIIVRTRFSLVFYVSRTLGVVSSTFVLLAFLSESFMLHRRLITTLVAREQEREGQRTAIDIVVGTLAHELRQPLTSILLDGQAGRKLLAMGPGASEEIPGVFDDIRASAVRANEVIDSVRTMFAASAGDRGSIDINALVRDAADLTRYELEAHSVTLALDLAPNLPEITGHRGQLLEVMLNGVKNAIESLNGISDRQRELRIRTRHLDSHGVAITIEDSGIGLDPRTRSRAFDPFFSTKPRGMGLGLSICESIVSAHGGALSLRPLSPFGAVLHVELPGALAVERQARAGDVAAVSSRS